MVGGSEERSPPPVCKRLVLSVLPVLLLLAACAQDGGPWRKPGTSDATRAYDMRVCSEYARERLNSRAVRHTETYHSRAVAADDIARNDDLGGLRLMLQADRKRLERRFYGDCMWASGYRQAE